MKGSGDALPAAPEPVGIAADEVAEGEIPCLSVAQIARNPSFLRLENKVAVREEAKSSGDKNRLPTGRARIVPTFSASVSIRNGHHFGEQNGAAACGSLPSLQPSAEGPDPPTNGGRVVSPSKAPDGTHGYPRRKGHLAELSRESATPDADASSREAAPRPARGQAAPSARGGKPHASTQAPSAERGEPSQPSHTLPPSTTLFPVVRVSVVALQLHKAIRMMEDFPAAACDRAWLRVHGLLSSLRSRMLWLNEHSHTAAPCAPTAPPCAQDGIEVDVTALALRSRGIGHIELTGSGRHAV